VLNADPMHDGEISPNLGLDRARASLHFAERARLVELADGDVEVSRHVVFVHGRFHQLFGRSIARRAFGACTEGPQARERAHRAPESKGPLHRNARFSANSKHRASSNESSFTRKCSSVMR